MNNKNTWEMIKRERATQNVIDHHKGLNFTSNIQQQQQTIYQTSVVACQFTSNGSQF